MLTETASLTASRFNVRTVDPSGRLLCANTRSGVVVEIDQAVDDFLAGTGPAPDELASAMVAAGLAVEEGTDEIAAVFADYETARNDNVLALTISPTVACNLRCDYCFETEHPNRWQSDDEMDAIVRLVRRELRERQPSAFTVTWFGGEPLLHLRAIERMSRAFLGLASFGGVPYSASIITNGTRLTTEVAQRLRACRITAAQITLDGGRGSHEVLRIDRNGRGSFDAVMAGIESAVDVLDVVLRVHADRRSAPTIPGLLEELADRGLTDVSLGFHRIEPPGIFEPAGPVAKRFLTAAEFARLEVGWLQDAALLGFRAIQTIDTDHGPTPCAAVSPHHYSIEPGGRVNRCYADVAGPDPAGHLDADGLVSIEDAAWRDYLPADLGCADCAYLPLCVGGCPKARIDGGLNSDDDEETRRLFKEHFVCSSRKFNLAALMEAGLLA